MVSEDSDQLGSGFLAVHCRRDLDDVSQTCSDQMMAESNALHAGGKLVKVVALCGPQRMFPKERDDDPEQIRASSHGVPVEVLSVVVVARVQVKRAHTEEVA